MPYLYRRSSAPFSALRRPALLSSFSFFLSASTFSMAHLCPRAALRPLSSPLLSSRSYSLTLSFSLSLYATRLLSVCVCMLTLNLSLLCLALALLSPTLPAYRYERVARPTGQPVFPSIFYLAPVSFVVFVPFADRTTPPGEHPPSSVRLPAGRKDDTSGAIKSALIAAPDNSIPRVKIIGQERGRRASVGSPVSLDSRPCVASADGGTSVWKFVASSSAGPSSHRRRRRSRCSLAAGRFFHTGNTSGFPSVSMFSRISIPACMQCI